MLSAHTTFSRSIRLALGAVLLACPIAAVAQRHGGGFGNTSLGSGRPDGVDEKDTLKDFHEAMAVQATSLQMTEFQALVKITNAAKDKLDAMVSESGNSQRGEISSLEQALQSMLDGNKKFRAGFSEPQKSGLKETIKRMEKADSDLDLAAKQLDQSVSAEAANADLAGRALSLSKSLTDFSNEQLALGREMGITLASAQDVTFNLPAVKAPITVGSRKFFVVTAGVLSQTAMQGDRRTFKLAMDADFTDLQQSFTEVMRRELDQPNACGERLAIRRATILSDPPASQLDLQLHFERWLCSPALGSTELAESDGAVEMKLTPAIGKSGGVELTVEFKRIDASGMLADELKSDLGDDLRAKVAKSLADVIQSAADFKTILPGAVQRGATLQSVRFEDAGAGVLTVLLEGQVQASNDQINLLASQLNGTVASAGMPTQ
ncbi:MAG TPA: hypothetical protein VMD76_10135 [Candidatus Sulfotelmatobacter sp.]|nr:hypothetical protein [Candidatus Sulfotelmatobacter sp.]